jgi:hypothetical protein
MLKRTRMSMPVPLQLTYYYRLIHQPSDSDVEQTLSENRKNVDRMATIEFTLRWKLQPPGRPSYCLRRITMAINNNMLKINIAPAQPALSIYPLLHALKHPQQVL